MQWWQYVGWKYVLRSNSCPIPCPIVRASSSVSGKGALVFGLGFESVAISAGAEIPRSKFLLRSLNRDRLSASPTPLSSRFLLPWCSKRCCDIINEFFRPQRIVHQLVSPLFRLSSVSKTCKTTPDIHNTVTDRFYLIDNLICTK